MTTKLQEARAAMQKETGKTGTSGQAPPSIAKKAKARESAAAKAARKEIESMFPESMFTPTSFVIPEGTDYATWAKAVQLLERVAGGIQWWIGDALAYGDRFGEQAAQAVDATGVEPKTLMSWRTVCDRIPVEDRIESLTWTHHKYAAELGGPEGSVAKVRRALRKCDKESMTTDEMRQYVNTQKPGYQEPADDDQVDDEPAEDATRHVVSLVTYVDVADAEAADKIIDRAKEFVKTETAKIGMKNVRVTVSEK